VFAVCAVVSLVNPQLGVYLLLLLVVTGRIEGASANRARREPGE
jgi:hypothetical protein